MREASCFKLKVSEKFDAIQVFNPMRLKHFLAENLADADTILRDPNFEQISFISAQIIEARRILITLIKICGEHFSTVNSYQY